MDNVQNLVAILIHHRHTPTDLTYTACFHIASLQYLVLKHAAVSHNRNKQLAFDFVMLGTSKSFHDISDAGSMSPVACYNGTLIFIFSGPDQNPNLRIINRALTRRQNILKPW
jgi:hypothetical protein